MKRSGLSESEAPCLTPASLKGLRMIEWIQSIANYSKDKKVQEQSAGRILHLKSVFAKQSALVN